MGNKDNSVFVLFFSVFYVVGACSFKLCFVNFQTATAIFFSYLRLSDEYYSEREKKNMYLSRYEQGRNKEAFMGFNSLKCLLYTAR